MCKCEKCNHLRTDLKISNIIDFGKVIETIRKNLKDGTLKQSRYWPKGKDVIEMPPFEKEEWGDIVIYYFECHNCKQLFKLSVEMYHGSGGFWKPVEQ